MAQACRHAPTLLDYKPSYKGVLKKKEKKKESEEGQLKEGPQSIAGATQKRKKVVFSTEGTRQKRQKGVRLPKIGYTAAEWLTPLGADDVAEQTAEEMSRRNIPRPPILTKLANSAKGSGSSGKEPQQREKKQKVLADTIQLSVPQVIPVADSRASDPREKELIANPHVDLIDLKIEAAILRQFSPSYTMPDDRVLLMKDSVKEEPNLAVTC